MASFSRSTVGINILRSGVVGNISRLSTLHTSRSLCTASSTGMKSENTLKSIEFLEKEIEDMKKREETRDAEVRQVKQDIAKDIAKGFCLGSVLIASVFFIPMVFIK